jgi:hypothetical protein
MTENTGKIRLRKIDTIDERNAVATYEASRDGKVLGTVTKFDEPTHKDVPTWKSGRRELKVRNYRIISWTHSRDIPHEAYETRADCLKDLERVADNTNA